KKTMPRITSLIHTSTQTILPLVLMVSFTTASPRCGPGAARWSHATSAGLVRDVREATRQFLDVNNAGTAGYGPAFGCVSGPDHGAMGIHYVNGTLVVDGLIDVAHPEALIYEPVGN